MVTLKNCDTTVTWPGRRRRHDSLAWKTCFLVSITRKLTSFISTRQQPRKFRNSLVFLTCDEAFIFASPKYIENKKNPNHRLRYSQNENIPWSVPWLVFELSAAWQSGRHPPHPHSSIALSKYWGRRILLFDQPQHWSRKKRWNSIRAILSQTIWYSSFNCLQCQLQPVRKGSH